MALVSDLVQLGIRSRQAEFLGDEQTTALGAAGLNQATAAQIVANITRVTGAVLGVSEGVRLPIIVRAKQTTYVVHNAAGMGINVYPGIGDFFNALASGVPRLIPNGGTAICVRAGFTGWIVTLGT